MADNIKKNEEEFSQLQQFAMEEPAPTPQQPAQMAEASTLQEQPDQPTATQAAAPTTQPLIQQQAAAPITPIAQQQAAAPIAQQPTPQQLIAQRAAQQAEQRTAQPQMFGQPQQPQPAQPRQTLMTPTTAGQRYRQILQQNVPQAQAVASGLAQAISTPEAEAQRRLAAAQQEFQKRITEAGLDRDEKATKEIFGRIAQLQAGQEISPEDLAKLQRIADTREDFGTGEGIRTEDFLSLENYLQAVSQAQEAQEMARLAGDTGTRQTLLRQLVRRPEYTSGQALLDSLLAGGTAPAAQTIQDVRSRLLEQDVLGKAEEQTLKDIEKARATEQKEIDSAYEDIQKFLDGDTGALSGLESTIRDRVVSEAKRAKELNEDIDILLQPKVAGKTNAIIGDTDEERQLIEKLGLTPEQVQGINAVEPKSRTSLIERLKEDVTEQTVTSAEELAKLNALYKIADITGRKAPRLAVAEGEDLGTLAEQKAKVSKEAIESGRKQTDVLIKSAKDAVKDTLSSGIENYEYGKNMSISSATKDLYNKMTKDIGKADKDFVIKQVTDPLKKANMDLKAELARLGRADQAEAIRMNASQEEINKQLKEVSNNYVGQKLGNYGKAKLKNSKDILGLFEKLGITKPFRLPTFNTLESIQKAQDTIKNAEKDIEKQAIEEVNRRLAGTPGPMLESTRREQTRNLINERIKSYQSARAFLRGLEEFTKDRADIKLLSDNIGLEV